MKTLRQQEVTTAMQIHCVDLWTPQNGGQCLSLYPIPKGAHDPGGPEGWPQAIPHRMGEGKPHPALAGVQGVALASKLGEGQTFWAHLWNLRRTFVGSDI